MTAEELHVAISQANNWTSTSWLVMPDIVLAALAQLDQLTGAAEAQLTLHVALQDEPRTCSSCRKKKPAVDYGEAYRACKACSDSRKKTHALKPRRCTSYRKEKPVVDYGGALRTCRACSDSKKRAHALKQAALTGAPIVNMEPNHLALAPAAHRKGKKVCGTKNWCLISDFNESQTICRPCQEKARTANAATEGVPVICCQIC